MSTTPNRLTCPDEGACHHSCPSVAACFRVVFCGPLSGAYPGDNWPEGIAGAAAAARDAMPARPIEDYIVRGRDHKPEPPHSHATDLDADTCPACFPADGPDHKPEKG